MSEKTEKKSQKKHDPQKLSAKWFQDPIKSKYVSGTVGDIYFICKVCQEKYKCDSFYGHCLMHENQPNVKKDENQALIPQFSMKNIEREQFEFLLIKFIVANNLPFSLVDSLIILLKALKNQDMIRQVDFSKIDRRRAVTMTNKCISQSIKEKIEKEMDSYFYHLIIDEVSDKFGKGYLGIFVRFLEENKPMTKFYRLIKLEDSATGEELISILKKIVLCSKKREKNLISLITDGATAMCGENKGVSTRIAEIVPDLFWLQCICHCIHLTISTACANAMATIRAFAQSLSPMYK